MSKEIRIYTWEEFDEDCKKIVKHIKKEKWNIKYVYGPPRGGCCLAVKLSHMLKAKYISSLNYITNPKNILICDDVSDTGKTLKYILQEFNGLDKPNFITIFIKPQTEFIPDIYCRTVQNNVWIQYPWEK